MKEDIQLLHYWASIRRNWRLVASVTLLTMLGVALFISRQPYLYRAQTKIRVEMEQPAIMFYPNMPNYAPYDRDRFYRTQNQILQSNPILMPVVRELNLGETWFGKEAGAEEAALGRVRHHLRVIPLAGSTIITISYEDQNPRLATQIANTVVQNFITQRKRVRGQFLSEVMENMRHQLELNRQKLDHSEAALRRFQKDKGLTFIQNRPLNEERMGELNDAYIKAKTRRLAKEVQLQELIKLSPDEKISSLVIMIDNRHFQDLRARLDKNEVELASLEQRFQPKHPEVQEVKARISKIKNQLNELSRGMLNGLRTEYEKAQKEEDLLAQALGEVRVEDQLKEESKTEYRHLKRQIEVDQEVLLTTRKRMEEATVGESIPKVRIEVVQKAEIPKVPAKPKKLLSLLLGSLMGLGGGIALVLFLDYLNQRMVSIRDVERYLKLPVLALIPRGTSLLRDEPEPSPLIEPYRMLRANINCLPRSSAELKTLLITSAIAGEGKSNTAVNLGFCLAKMGDRVIVIDADLRRPVVHKILELNQGPGLTELLQEEASVDNVIQTVFEDKPNLAIITCGDNLSQGINLLNSRAIKKILPPLREQYDLIIVDSPQILGVSDTIYLAEAADAAILVVEHNRHPRSLVLQAKRQLEETGVSIIGVVFNNVAPYELRHYAHYYYLTGVEDINT